jgi:outer membrane protein assembly factor BamB
MNLYPDKKAKDGLQEVVYGAMDGKIYFFDLDDGQPTRDPIVLGEPIKGSVTVHPGGLPLLFVGQGIQYKGRFGYHIYSLLTGEALYFLNGYDNFARRGWAAFDSNPLIDVANDRMVLCGENGLVYVIDLHTDYDAERGTLSIAPEAVKYRYSTRHGEVGMENSPAAFDHYLFFADNTGVVQCVDLQTLTPVWARFCTDDTDASVVLDWETDGERLALYTACEVDHQGEGGYGYLRKLDAENGALLWEHSYPCHFSETNGGAMATPAVGRAGTAAGEYVYFWVAKLKGYDGDGALVCLDKRSGEVVWENILPRYGWSSPVLVYAEGGEAYLTVCDSGGILYLFDAVTGEELDQIALGANVESSPAVADGKLVVGTRGQRIYGVALS